MTDYPHLSKAQRLVMEILWEKGEAKNADILEALKDTKDWSRQTVKTYLIQLTQKGMVAVKPSGSRSYIYYPIIDKEQFLADEASIYLENNFNGLSHLVAGLVKREKVSEEELDELEAFIQQYRKR